MNFTRADENFYMDDDVERQVQQIMASAATSLTKGNVKTGAFPFKYVYKGSDRRKVAFNSLSLPEHQWGILRMANDPKIDPSIKPCLYNHLEEIIEDCLDFDWETGVRKWSEQVFSLIGEDRLPRGWHSVARIQMFPI